MTQQPADFLVLGGGLVGLAFANLLAARLPGVAERIVVVDRAAPAPVTGDVGLRVSAWSAASTALLNEAGAWQQVPASRQGAYRRMVVWRESGPEGRDSIHFDAAEQGLPALGHIVENDLLRALLWEQASQAGVRFEVGAGPRQLQQDDSGVELELDDGRVLTASLLIGADGQSSWTRQAVGLTRREWPYHQQGLVTHAQPAQEHQQTAWQRFMPGGPLALLPLADGRVSVVWSCPVQAATKLLAGSQAELGAALTRASGGVLGELHPTVSARGFPLMASHTHTYAAERVVLIGDAAHQVHPLAGLGANLGLKDADVLAGELAAFLRQPAADPGDRKVLRRYERARKGDNLATLTTMDLLHRAFSGGQPELASLAGSGLGLVDRLPVVKRALATYAVGGGSRS
jgi:2-octaprenylphenol hydroxylase